MPPANLPWPIMRPVITVTKTRANTPIDCNQDITWDYHRHQ